MFGKKRMSGIKISILYSGGLDSRIMWELAKRNNPNDEIKLVYWDHGQPVARREIETLPNEVEIRKVDWLNLPEQELVHQRGRREGKIMIPGRNLALAVLTACQDLPDELWIGALHGETHEKGTDKNYTFLTMLQDTLNYVIGPFLESKISVKFPLEEMGLNKMSAVSWAIEVGISPEELLKTRSCHSSTTDRCGNCIQCFKRYCAFGMSGFKEEYDVHPLMSEFGKKFVKDMLNCEAGIDDYYDEDSRAEIIPYLRRFHGDK